MKGLPIVAITTILILNAAQEGQAAEENKPRDYGQGIYSTQGQRDNYTTESGRQGLYTTKDSGSIYDSSDKREGLYTTNESKSDNRDVSGNKLKDF